MDPLLCGNSSDAGYVSMTMMVVMMTLIILMMMIFRI